jgi:hypothetical protein
VVIDIIIYLLEQKLKTSNMKNTKRYKNATKLFPNSKISRVGSFFKENNTIYILNHDENVVTIVDGKDLTTLLNLLPLDPQVDYIRHLQTKNLLPL